VFLFFAVHNIYGIQKIGSSLFPIEKI